MIVAALGRIECSKNDKKIPFDSLCAEPVSLDTVPLFWLFMEEAVWTLEPMLGVFVYSLDGLPLLRLTWITCAREIRASY